MRAIGEKYRAARKLERSNVRALQWINRWKLDLLAGCAHHLFGPAFAERLKTHSWKRVENLEHFADGTFAGLLSLLLKKPLGERPKD
jgi:hypothetical protein